MATNAIFPRRSTKVYRTIVIVIIAINMRNRFCLILLLISALGCSSNDKRYDDIDFIAYSWGNPNKGKVWKLYCTTYALIDNSGQCELIVESFYPKSEIKYCKIILDKDVVGNIINASKNIQKELDLRPKVGTSMYDGPSLKIRINKSNESKTIHFFEDDSTKNKEYVKLYRIISSSFMTNRYEEIESTDYLLERKLQFVNFSMKSDSTLRPPPPPSEEVIAIIRKQ